MNHGFSLCIALFDPLLGKSPVVAPRKHIRTPPIPKDRYPRDGIGFLTLLLARLDFIGPSRFLDDVDERWLNSLPLLLVDSDTVPMVLCFCEYADLQLVRGSNLQCLPRDTRVFTGPEVYPGEIVCVFQLAEDLEGVVAGISSSKLSR